MLWFISIGTFFLRKKCSTIQSCIFSEVTSYKIHVCPLEEGGGQKWLRFGARSCWMIPKLTRGLENEFQCLSAHLSCACWKHFFLFFLKHVGQIWGHFSIKITYLVEICSFLILFEAYRSDLGSLFNKINIFTI